MRKLAAAAAAISILAISGCTTTERTTGTGALIGGLGGAAIGAGLSGDAGGALAGAAIGAAGGAVAGNVIGRSQERAGDCVYRDTYTGERYVAACP